MNSNAKNLQMEVIIHIIQEGRQITFYSIKLYKPQQSYTLTEKELLSIVEALEDFQTLYIFLVRLLKIYTGHINITCKNFNTNITLRCRFILV